jgi:hypothetical protein
MEQFGSQARITVFMPAAMHYNFLITEFLMTFLGLSQMPHPIWDAECLPLVMKR